MLNNEWLAKTYGYQSTHFGVDYHRMRSDIEYRMTYMKENLFAAVVEVGEAANEQPVKSWAKGDKQAIHEAKRGKYLGEMVDVLFFIANALTAAGITDAELEQAYLAKMGVNQARRANGYDGVSTKCEKCNGATDEPSMVPVEADGRLFCSADCAIAAGAIKKIA